MARSSRRRRSFSSRGRRRLTTAGPWRFGPIPVIGVVGGIGAGKSEVTRLLEQRGAFVLDADKVGHALLDQTPAREQVIERFGPAILADSGDAAEAEARVDRGALGAIVFADPAARKDLEGIMHPRMRATFVKAIDRCVRRGKSSAVVLDAAVLFEAGWDNLCDLIVFVEAPDDLRLKRIGERRGWTEADLSAREAAQWPLDQKRVRSSAVISNSGSLEALDQAVGRFWSHRVEARAERSRARDTQGPSTRRSPGPETDEPPSVGTS